MSMWRVKVKVDYDYEVEADTKEEAVGEGWNYEDYKQFSSVNSIEVELNNDEEFLEANND